MSEYRSITALPTELCLDICNRLEWPDHANMGDVIRNWRKINILPEYQAQRYENLPIVMKRLHPREYVRIYLPSDEDIYYHKFLTGLNKRPTLFEPHIVYYHLFRPESDGRIMVLGILKHTYTLYQNTKEFQSLPGKVLKDMIVRKYGMSWIYNFTFRFLTSSGLPFLSVTVGVQANRTCIGEMLSTVRNSLMSQTSDIQAAGMVKEGFIMKMSNFGYGLDTRNGIVDVQLVSEEDLVL